MGNSIVNNATQADQAKVQEIYSAVQAFVAQQQYPMGLTIKALILLAIDGAIFLKMPRTEVVEFVSGIFDFVEKAKAEAEGKKPIIIPGKS